jgi:hypothetical protein
MYVLLWKPVLFLNELCELPAIQHLGTNLLRIPVTVIGYNEGAREFLSYKNIFWDIICSSKSEEHSWATDQSHQAQPPFWCVLAPSLPYPPQEILVFEAIRRSQYSILDPFESFFKSYNENRDWQLFNDTEISNADHITMGKHSYELLERCRNDYRNKDFRCPYVLAKVQKGMQLYIYSTSSPLFSDLTKPTKFFYPAYPFCGGYSDWIRCILAQFPRKNNCGPAVDILFNCRELKGPDDDIRVANCAISLSAIDNRLYPRVLLLTGLLSDHILLWIRGTREFEPIAQNVCIVYQVLLPSSATYNFCLRDSEAALSESVKFNGMNSKEWTTEDKNNIQRLKKVRRSGQIDFFLRKMRNQGHTFSQALAAWFQESPLPAKMVSDCKGMSEGDLVALLNQSITSFWAHCEPRIKKKLQAQPHSDQNNMTKNILSQINRLCLTKQEGRYQLSLHHLVYDVAHGRDFSIPKGEQLTKANMIDILSKCDGVSSIGIQNHPSQRIKTMYGGHHIMAATSITQIRSEELGDFELKHFLKNMVRIACASASALCTQIVGLQGNEEFVEGWVKYFSQQLVQLSAYDDKTCPFLFGILNDLKQEESLLPLIGDREKEVHHNVWYPELSSRMRTCCQKKLGELKKQMGNIRQKCLEADPDKFQLLLTSCKKVYETIQSPFVTCQTFSVLWRARLARLIYIVDTNNNIRVAPEKCGHERPTHSELAQGKSVHAAGELEFSKDSEDSPWHLIQINNGSGHYRPDTKALQLVKQLLEAQNIDTSQAKLRHCLEWGAPLVSASYFGGPDLDSSTCDEEQRSDATDEGDGSSEDLPPLPYSITGETGIMDEVD